VRYLLDTCTFLWLGQSPARLSAESARLIDLPEHEFFVSDVSVWEVALKHSTGKLPLPDAPRVWVAEKFAHHQLQRLPLTHAAIFRSGELPRAHADPFDRLLAAQALEEQMTLLSPDVPLSLLGAARVW
jgi:PIN domain nuclease of toxin-antitoxin system